MGGAPGPASAGRTRRLTAGQLDYLRNRPLYPLTLLLHRFVIILVPVMMIMGMVGAWRLSLGLFCALVTLAPFLTATTYLVRRQLEQVVLAPGESGFWLGIACANAMWADAVRIRRR